MWYYLSVILALVLDQLSKAWILDHIKEFEMREIIPGLFNLVYVTNTGAAFSFLADVDAPWRHWFFLSISLVAVVAITFYNRSLRHNGGGVFTSLALGFVAGGALGNVIDRLRYGAVTDFLDFYHGSYHWPAFNLADSFICVGAVLLVVLSFFNSGPREDN